MSGNGLVLNLFARGTGGRVEKRFKPTVERNLFRAEAGWIACWFLFSLGFSSEISHKGHVDN